MSKLLRSAHFVAWPTIVSQLNVNDGWPAEAIQWRFGKSKRPKKGREDEKKELKKEKVEKKEEEKEEEEKEKKEDS